MKFIYSAQADNFRKDAVYENPRYFEKLPPQGLKQYEEIIVIGDWPRVQAALDAAELDWRHGDKDDDEGHDTTDNSGAVRGASTGSKTAAGRQKEGVVNHDLVRNGPDNEGEGEGELGNVNKTGDGLETVAREAGLTTDAHMQGSEQVVEIPGDWEGLDWQAMRNLAGNFTDETVVKKDQAIEAIRAELAKRGQK